MSLAGQQPALREQVAERARDGLEALALAGVFPRDGMIEDQMPIVVVGVPGARELEAAHLVLFQFLCDGCLGHGTVLHRVLNSVTPALLHSAALHRTAPATYSDR